MLRSKQPYSPGGTGMLSVIARGEPSNGEPVAVLEGTLSQQYFMTLTIRMPSNRLSKCLSGAIAGNGACQASMIYNVCLRPIRTGEKSVMCGAVIAVRA